MQTTATSNSKMTTRQMTLIALMTAVTCILGPLSIPLPFSPVPISFTNLAIYLSLYVLGTSRATLSYLVYLLIGMTGLPVFSGFSGGFTKLAGPTGGYLVGFIFMALISGVIMRKFQGNKIMEGAGMVLGTAVCYVFGTAWLCVQAGMNFKAGLAAGVIPYIPGDLIKIVIAIVVGTALRTAVNKISQN
ncbi:MAG: biotin transporter BioY [Blautia sp.]